MDKCIKELFTALHSHPELSGNENATKAILIGFLSAHTDLTLHDMGAWLWSIHSEECADDTIAFRADMDAIKGKDGCAFHGCGHDGHMTTMCALAREISGRTLGKNIIFIFQPSEENGQGAAIIAPHLASLGIKHIYGFHNIPGHKAGRALVRCGTFACASKGLTLTYSGRQSHAAYPETGANPSFAIAQTVSEIQRIRNSSEYKALVLATIVHISVGEENAFGVNAGHGTLSVTIRAELEEELSLLQSRITAAALSACEADGIELSCEEFDVFPETANSRAEYDRVCRAFDSVCEDYEVLSVPMRWSEDFGHYLKVTDGFFFGIGSGESQPALHTDEYSYNTDMIEKSVGLLLSLI